VDQLLGTATRFVSLESMALISQDRRRNAGYQTCGRSWRIDEFPSEEFSLVVNCKMAASEAGSFVD